MSSTYHNIFPQSLPTGNSFPLATPPSPPHHQSLIQINRNKLKTIQAQYFQNQYTKIKQQKQRQKQQQRLEKQRDRLMALQKHNAYQTQISRMRQKKQMEKDYLSTDYKQTIDYHENKNKYEKQINKIIEKQVLNSPTWLRDADIERENQLKKKLYYNKALEDHKRAQQERKKKIQQSQEIFKNKLKRQAEDLLKKQYNEIQAKHRQKSLFLQRQNQILGVRPQEPNLEESRTIFEKQRQLKGLQRQLYRQGLQAQYQKQQTEKYSRKRAFSEQKGSDNMRYNPITNPLPFVYKNPNVLKMLGQQ